MAKLRCNGWICNKINELLYLKHYIEQLYIYVWIMLTNALTTINSLNADVHNFFTPDLSAVPLPTLNLACSSGSSDSTCFCNRFSGIL